MMETVARLLVVDDNADNRDLLVRRLGRLGHGAPAVGGFEVFRPECCPESAKPPQACRSLCPVLCGATVTGTGRFPSQASGAPPHRPLCGAPHPRPGSPGLARSGLASFGPELAESGMTVFGCAARESRLRG